MSLLCSKFYLSRISHKGILFYFYTYSLLFHNNAQHKIIVTALLEYLSVLLEYIDPFSAFGQHLYDIASYKLFLVPRSNLSFLAY